MKTLLISSLLALSAAAFAADAPAKAAAPASAEFEKIKSLAGDWRGTTVMDGKTVEVKTNFRLTAGGSAVVETMDAGTPHEMTNVYHLVDGKLRMTHYCLVGNAPEMRVAKSDGAGMTFEAVKSDGIDPKKTPHMHDLSYSFVDKDHLTTTWSAVNMGQEHASKPVFSYARVP